MLAGLVVKFRLMVALPRDIKSLDYLTWKIDRIRRRDITLVLPDAPSEFVHSPAQRLSRQ